MKEKDSRECTSCGATCNAEHRSYRYTESGLPNVVFQGVETADCPNCENTDVTIPQVAKIHRAIVQALIKSPARLTGAQFRFLRKHLGLSGEEMGKYLHTDKTKISKWETEEHSIGPATDRLIRLLVTALDSDLRGQITSVAEHLPQVLDQSGSAWELHVDVSTLQTSFLRVSKAA